MKKINISINMLEIQGGQLIERDGQEFFIMKIGGKKTRAKKHTNGKLYLDLDVVERKEVDPYGKTHFVVEPITKAEREAGLKLPIIGNGKEFGDGSEVKKRVIHQQSLPRPEREAEEGFGSNEEFQAGMNDDEIPF